MVERRSRFTLLGHLPGGHSAAEVADAITANLLQLREQLKAHTLTWDQGCEMARHADIAIAAGVKVFFCDPASPWQRPTNEHQRAAAAVPPQGHRPVGAPRHPAG